MIIGKEVISVYNRFITGLPPFGSTETWLRTVIKFAQWEDSADRNVTNIGATFIDKHINIYIPKTANTEGKKYMRSSEWILLPNDKKAQAWTLAVDSSIITLGETPIITSLYTMQTLRNEHRHCLIKAIEDLSNSPIMPHWEVAGI